MPKKSKSNSGDSKAISTGASFEQELGPLMQAIDSAVANISDEDERRSVRRTVGEAVHGAMRQLSASPRTAGTVGTKTIGDALNAGVGAIKQVQNLGFVEFTTGLINGTFDALIAATVRQMDAYAELVADLAKTLTQFQSENVDEGKITAHLAARYSDGAGGTTVRPSYTFQDTPADPNAGTPAKPGAEKLAEVAKALIEETKANKHPLKFEAPNELDQNQTSFTDPQVRLIRTAVGEMLAISMIEHLRAMAREGMARIVITEGELLSKLTFKVSTTEELQTQKSRLDETSIDANVKGRFGGKRWGVQFSASYNQLNVSTMDETSFDAVTMNAEIVGMVKLRFRTESYPPIVTSNTIA